MTFLEIFVWLCVLRLFCFSLFGMKPFYRVVLCGGFHNFPLSLPFTVPIKYKVLAKSTFRVKSSQSERVFLCHVKTRSAVYLRL